MGGPMTDRREFLGLTAAALAAATLPACSTHHTSTAAPRLNETVLFQGDSITDNFRTRNVTTANTAHGLGSGYPFLVAAALLREKPAMKLRFFNRGVSGDRVPQLVERWQKDTLELRPDILSVLIGVNDLWHKMMGRSKGTPEEYETEYRSLLERTRETLPDVRLIVMEPFVLQTGHVKDTWMAEFEVRRNAAARVAAAVSALFVPLHDMFQKLAKTTEPTDWLYDGVHPTAAGHFAIAEQWRNVVGI
jgi:lysophospholipase L1-like esterase